MSKMKQYVDQMTSMEAYQKGYEKGQEDVVTISASTIYDNGVMQGRKELVEWVEENRWKSVFLAGDVLLGVEEWQAKLREWGIDGD